VIDAGMPQDVNTVTLSYTFFEVEGRNSVGGDGNDRGRAG
jgi:cytochrome c oxidase assembly protein Cox11